jgi:crotonobetainyl-CoA:carnitine CoA-transferase CaiB-like acyl-CoA transferase
MPPIQVPGALADMTAALCLAYGIVTALYTREHLGVGQEVDVSLLRGMMHVMWMIINQVLMTGSEIKRQDRRSVSNPLFNHYECSDGGWILLGLLQSDRYWPDFCKIMGIQELQRNPKFENQIERERNCEELISILDSVFATKTKGEWLTILKEGEDFVYSSVNTVSELCSDPQLFANNYLVNFDHPVLGLIKQVGLLAQFSKTPGSIRMAAPELGQHTEEILTQNLGYSWEQIAELQQEGVI